MSKRVISETRRLSLLTSFIARYQLRDANAEVVIEHEHLATSDQSTIDVNVDRVAGQLIQRDHGSFALTEHVLQVHVRASQLDFQIEFHIAQQFKRGVLLAGWSAGKFFQLKRLGRRGEWTRRIIDR